MQLYKQEGATSNPTEVGLGKENCYVYLLLFESNKQKYIEDEEGKGCWEENAFVDKEQQFCLLHT